MAGQSRRTRVVLDRSAIERLAFTTERQLIRFAIDVQNRARQLCPVDTGRLRSSITHRPGRDARGPFVEVGTNVEYAIHVELGTRFQEAQPFLRPALAEAAGSRLSGAA